MLNFIDVYSDALFFIIIGIIIIIVMPLCSKKDKNRISVTIFAIIAGITLVCFGVNNLKTIENPDIKVYIGEYVDYSKSGKNSIGEYTFDSHIEGELKIVFRAAQLANVMGGTPEYGKWYAIYYLPDSILQNVVKVEEISPPDYYKESSEKFSEIE